MIPHWILHIFLLILYTAVCIQSTEKLLEKCYSDPPICLTLYRASEPSHWWDAYDYCIAQGANLLTIPDHKTQTVVDGFLKDLAADQMVWISGKQSDAQNAVDLSGHVITETIQDNPSGYSFYQNCVYMQITANTLQHTLYWDDCDETQARLRAVCQYPHTDDSLYSGISSNGQCFYLDSPDVNINWFTARERCQKKPGSDLIYSQLNNTDVLSVLRDAMSPNKPDGSPTCWTGIHKRPWQWITGEAMNTVDMEYFNFEAGYMHLKVESCLILVNKNGIWYWNTRTCHEGINHFICSKHQVLPLTTPTTTQDETASSSASRAPPELTNATQTTYMALTLATTTSTEVTMPPPSSSHTKKNGGFNPLYLIPVIVAVVTGIVVAVVLVVRKKRKLQPSVPVYVNDESARNQEDPSSPSYQDIEEYLTTEQTSRVLHHTPEQTSRVLHHTPKQTTRVLNHTLEPTTGVLNHTPEQTTTVLNHTPEPTTRVLYQNVGNILSEDFSSGMSASNHLDTMPPGGDHENTREDLTSNPYSELDPNSFSYEHTGTYTALTPQARS